MKKAFIITSIFLYVLFIIEAITGYWIEKPRVIGQMFGNIIDRRDAYVLHGTVLPVVLYLLILFHTSVGLRKYFIRSRWLVFVIINVAVILFLTYLHLL